MKFFAVFCLTLYVQQATAGFWDQFVDPLDGRWDASEMLAKDRAFLPVPILITEPALGYGGGAALVFFHQDEARKRQQADPNAQMTLPPSVSALVGVATANGTWVGAGGHFGSWKDDHIRYTGALAKFDAHLDFYGIADNGVPGDSLAFSADGWYLLQEIKFRLTGSDFFLGARYDRLTTENRFDFGLNLPNISAPELDATTSGLALLANHDSRDNLITPSRGHYGELVVTRYDQRIGSDFDFTKTRLRSLSYWPLRDDFVLGVRLDGTFTDGDVPFYLAPSIEMRGIRMMRYQGNDVAVAELEGRWAVDSRWSLVGFVGGGRAADSFSDLPSAETRIAGGVGFRYKLARRLGLHTGLDIARGPEEWAFYIQVGQAWL